MRSAVAAAQQAQGTAGTTAGQYNAAAGNIAANLIPFATRMMTNPTGYSQRDIGAQLTAGLAGSGGATSALTGAADRMGTVTRNPMGFSSALDEAARQRAKGVAGISEDIAAKNAQVKLQQQQQAASTLGGLYGTASKAGADWGGIQSQDIRDMVEANKTGWLQNMNDVIQSATGAYKAYREK